MSLLLLALLPALPSLAEAPLKPYFTVASDERGGQVTLTGELQDCLCASVEITANLQNLRPSVPLPIERDFTEPRTALGHLRPIDRARRSSFDTTARIAVGRRGAHPAPGHLYRLPFPLPATFKVIQGYGGSFTHDPGTPNECAVDWAMPEGTPVLAAREGRVVAWRADQERGGIAEEFFERVNQVFVEHADGTVAEYQHLRFRGVAVKLGQRVATGDLLGWSGATGYVKEPQLHVRVYRVTSAGREESLPVRWDTRERYLTYALRDEFPFKITLFHSVRVPPLESR